LLVLGVIGWVVPVMPGWLFVGAGVLLLAPRVRLFRRLIAWMYERFPALRGRLRAFRFPKASPDGGENPAGIERDCAAGPGGVYSRRRSGA